MSKRVGETIAVSIRDFQAQSYDLYQSPAYGSFLRVTSTAPGIEIFAVVEDIRTEPIDTSRPVIARGSELPSEEAIYEENPHFRHVMRTRFSAIVAGYRQEEQIVHMLPPQPPRIHGFVHACTQEEVSAFTERFGFLRPLMAAKASNDLISACVRTAAAARASKSGYLVGLGKELMTLLAEDPERLNVLLPLLGP